MRGALGASVATLATGELAADSRRSTSLAARALQQFGSAFVARHDVLTLLVCRFAGAIPVIQYVI